MEKRYEAILQSQYYQPVKKTEYLLLIEEPRFIKRRPGRFIARAIKGKHVYHVVWYVTPEFLDTDNELIKFPDNIEEHLQLGWLYYNPCKYEVYLSNVRCGDNTEYKLRGLSKGAEHGL